MIESKIDKNLARHVGPIEQETRVHMTTSSDMSVIIALTYEAPHVFFIFLPGNNFHPQHLKSPNYKAVYYILNTSWSK